MYLMYVKSGSQDPIIRIISRNHFKILHLEDLFERARIGTNPRTNDLRYYYALRVDCNRL